MGNMTREDMIQQLERLRQAAQTALSQAGDSEQIQAWHSEYLGRKGRLTAILRNLGSLSADERPQVGKVANDIKVALEAALQDARKLLRRPI